MSRFIVVLSLLAVSACTPERGKGIYNSRCVMCHGENGTGKAGLAKDLGIDLISMDLTSDKNRQRTDPELIEVVRQGRGKMQSFDRSRISDKDISALISHVRELQKAGR